MTYLSHDRLFRPTQNRHETEGKSRPLGGNNHESGSVIITPVEILPWFLHVFLVLTLDTLASQTLGLWNFTQLLVAPSLQNFVFHTAQHRARNHSAVNIMIWGWVKSSAPKRSKVSEFGGAPQKSGDVEGLCYQKRCQ